MPTSAREGISGTRWSSGTWRRRRAFPPARIGKAWSDAAYEERLARDHAAACRDRHYGDPHLHRRRPMDPRGRRPGGDVAGSGEQGLRRKIRGTRLKRTGHRRLMRLHAALVATALAGCAVGPDYRRPDPPRSPPIRRKRFRWRRPPLPGSAARRNGSFPAGRSPPGGGSCSAPRRWIDGSMRRLRTARHWSPPRRPCGGRRRSGAPAPGSSFQASTRPFPRHGRSRRGHPSARPDAQINPFTLYNASVDVSYTLDLFGRTCVASWRRCRRRSTTSGFSWRAPISRSHPTSSRPRFQEASLRAQLQATRDILATQEEAARADREAVRAGRRIARPTCSPSGRPSPSPGRPCRRWRKELAQTRHLLAVLAGRFPGRRGGSSRVPTSRISDCPEELPVSLPSSLVRQRPDIRVLRGAAARRERRGRRGHGEPLPADHAVRPVRHGGGADRRPLPPRHLRLGDRSGTPAAHLPRRGAGSDPSRRGRRLRPGRGPVPRDGPAGVPRTWPTCSGRWSTTR